MAQRSYTESYSLWLMPRGPLATQLQGEVHALCGRIPGAPPFAPHVTLLGGINRPQQEVLQAAEQLAATMQPYRVTFDRVSCGSIFHQCVYILCLAQPDTMAAGAAARAAYGLDPQAPYMPHLSLLYADIDSAAREAVAAEQQSSLFGGGGGGGRGGAVAESGFVVDTLAVWYTPVEDKSLLSWRQVAEFKLRD